MSIIRIRNTLFLILSLILFPLLVSSSIECDSTATCEILVRTGSECINGECSNPFASGCLARILENEDDNKSLEYKRVCNSEDDSDDSSSSSSLCMESDFKYDEVRVTFGNWESAIFLSWIIQILLSELLHVPVTLETGNPAHQFSFYDADPTTLYYPSKGYDWEPLFEANRVGGKCSSTDKPCAHVMPEVWNGQEFEWLDARERGEIEPVEGNGMVGKLSLYIPKFLAERDSSLVSFFGLRGRENQRKLAETFKRPTTWVDYCNQVSTNNCSSADTVAARAPTMEEADKFFQDGDYTGYFRYTDDNNCTLNPTTCTGHLVEASCSWSAYTTPQLYWNEIYLKSNGPLEANQGYPYSSMVEIWEAANATKEALIMVWYRPDITRQIFRKSSGEFQTVILPEPTYECTRNRNNETARCSLDIWERRGLEKGSCDYDPHALQKITARSLAELTNSKPEATRSPAYDMLRSIQVSNLAIEDMFDVWSDDPKGMNGYTAREAVCEWVADNLDLFQRYIPLGHPRTIQEGVQLYSRGATYVAIAVGALVTVVVCIVSVITWQKRNQRVMVYAQPIFVFLILSGLFLVAVGATIYPIEPSDASCIAKHWLVGVGYTLSLVPLLVKVAAINKLFRKAERMRRVKLSPKLLFAKVAGVTLFVVVYLTIWTAVDPPTRTEQMVLTDPQAGIVEIHVECASSSNVWIAVALGWNTLLLVCATVLAFQSRNIRQEFNESRTLAVMTYSHFIFLVLLLTMYFIQSNFTASTLVLIISFLLSFDTLSACVIYFLPKFLVLFTKQPLQSRRSWLAGSYSINASSQKENYESARTKVDTVNVDDIVIHYESKKENDAHGETAKPSRSAFVDHSMVSPIMENEEEVATNSSMRAEKVDTARGVPIDSALVENSAIPTMENEELETTSSNGSQSQTEDVVDTAS